MHLMLLDRRRSRWIDLLILTASVALGIGAAFGTEHLQSLTQYRSCDINDVYADMRGIFFGCIIVLAHIIFRKQEPEY